MTRRVRIGLAIASCAALVPLRVALPQQPSTAAPPPVGAQAQVKDAEDKARRQYGKGTRDYYRDFARRLQTIDGRPPPVAIPAPSAPASGTVDTPKTVPIAAQRFFSDKNLRRLIDLAAEEKAQTGRFSDVSEKIIRGVPAEVLVAAERAIPLKDAAEIAASSIGRSTGRGSVGAQLRTLPAGLKDMVVGLAELPATPQAVPSVSADPVDPYPETVALGRGARGPESKSLCSGVLISRSKDSQEGAVLTAAHCLREQNLTHVYIGHNVFTTPLCTNAPDHDAGMPIVAVQFMGGGSSASGSDIAIAFFRKATPPGYKHYFLDTIVKDATASIPNSALLQVLQKGLIKRQDMLDTVTKHARKLAQNLGIELENIMNDLAVQAQYNALADSLTPKKLPVGVVVVGFGATATTADRRSAGCKGWAEFDPTGYTECIDEGEGNCQRDREFVLREPENEGGSDTCPGDSGGPVFMETRDGAGQYVRYLVGLTSRAVRPDPVTQCGSGEGGIYSLVARDEVISFVTRALAGRGMAPNIARLAPPPTAPLETPTNGR